MCRILAVRDRSAFALAPLLRSFAEMARRSREYQGDGWGCAWREGGGWRSYHSAKPIWEDELEAFASSHLLVAHARSAFAGGEVRADHNMPFLDGPLVFAFNGELRGVRIRAAGRIGAEKLFDTARRLSRGDGAAGLARATALVHARSAYVKAMNVVLADGERVVVYSSFAEQEDYFTMHVARRNGRLVVCSQPLAGEPAWRPFPNGALEVFE
jgi:predicted glutamine amidotransferase